MFDSLKQLIISQKINSIKEEMQRAGASLETLLRDPDILKLLDKDIAWELISGVEASLLVLEQTVRRSLNRSDEVDMKISKALRDAQAAAVTLRQTIDEIKPFVETLYGVPSYNIKWHIEPPSSIKEQ